MVVDPLPLLADGTPTIESVLLNLGLPGVVILGLGAFAVGEIKEARDRVRRLEEDNRRLAEEKDRVYRVMAEQMMPALTNATNTTMEATRVIADINRREERLAAIEEGRRQALEDHHRNGPSA